MRSLLEFGADPAGVQDVSTAFYSAFAAGYRDLYLPGGKYRLVRSLEVPSETAIHLADDAEVFAAPGKDSSRKVHMVGNADSEGGNTGIVISGGLWNGNCAENVRTSYKDEDFVGLMFDFRNVDGLELSHLRVMNSSCYHFRLGEVRHFILDGIRFEDTLSPLCQDGIHVGGFCEYGEIRNIYAVSGALGDDLLAFNADDVFTYSHNYGMKQGPIRHIAVENIEAPNVYTGVRFLTISEEISDITLKNLKIGFRVHGLNMDACRYCEDPVFEDSQYPEGVGYLSDIVFDDLTLWKCNEGRELFTFESNCRNFTIRNFRRARELEPANNAPTMLMRHLCRSEVRRDEESFELVPGQEWKWDGDSFDLLTVNRI